MYAVNTDWVSKLSLCDILCVLSRGLWLPQFRGQNHTYVQSVVRCLPCLISALACAHKSCMAAGSFNKIFFSCLMSKHHFWKVNPVYKIIIYMSAFITNTHTYSKCKPRGVMYIVDTQRIIPMGKFFIKCIRHWQEIHALSLWGTAPRPFFFTVCAFFSKIYNTLVTSKICFC